MTLPSFIAERLFSCGPFLYPANHSLGLTAPAAFKASFLWKWDPHAVGGKIFLVRYKPNLTIKPVPRLLVSHLDQTRPYHDFLGGIWETQQSSRGRNNGTGSSHAFADLHC